MHLLFCCATGGELRVVKEEIKKLNLKMHLPVQYFCTGMGNHASIFSLTKKLLEHPETPYLIVNIGVCGYRGTYAPLVQLATLSHLELAKEVIIPILFPFAPLRSCLSAESVVFAPAVS